MNIQPESFQSRILKKSLKYMKFKQSILKNLDRYKNFVNPATEQKRPPKRLTKKYDVEIKTVENRDVYIIKPKTNISQKTLLYMHGGAYMANALGIHWKFIDKLISSTHLTVILPDYPLAPEYNWTHGFNFMEELQTSLLDYYPDKIYMGDSAGAGLILSWVMELRNRGSYIPGHVILLSPWLDISMSNNQIKEIEHLDPYLSSEDLLTAGNYWANHLNPKDWRVSPIYGELANLPQISIFTGSNDILFPDAKLFLYKSSQITNNIDLHEYSGMIHDWMFFDIPEAQRCIETLVNIICGEN